MPLEVIVVGAGGHGREVLGVVRRSSELVFGGFVDDVAPDRNLLARIDAPYLGTIDQLRMRKDVNYLLALGDGLIRRSVRSTLPAFWRSPVVVHPAASMDGDVRLGEGCVVFAQATVTTNIQLGLHTHIGRGSAVGHDCVIGDFVTVMPLASVSGNVSIGDGATIGAGAVIRQGQRIGEGAYVGAGAVVVTDVGPGVTVVGNPARPLGG